MSNYKIGGGNKLQEYDKSTGHYGSASFDYFYRPAPAAYGLEDPNQPISYYEKRKNIIKAASFKHKNAVRERLGDFNPIQRELIVKEVKHFSFAYAIEINTYKNGATNIQGLNPGKVPRSYAVYYNIFNRNGKIVLSRKTTVDPNGKIVHDKNKLKARNKK